MFFKKKKKGWVCKAWDSRGHLFQWEHCYPDEKIGVSISAQSVQKSTSQVLWLLGACVSIILGIQAVPYAIDFIFNLWI
jgi:hypothetical protein